MPKIVTPLTNTKIKNLKPKKTIYRVSDGNGLVLEIKPNGKKVWRVRYTLFQKSKTYTIGDYPTISLAEARAIALEIKNKVLKDIDPVLERQEKNKKKELQDKKKFKIILDEFFELKSKDLSKKYIEKQKGRAKNYILPFIGEKSIDLITKSDIVSIIKSVTKIETPTTKNTDKIETTNRVFQIIQQVYKFALHNDYTEIDTTARIDIKAIIPKSQTTHFKAITDEKEIKIIYKIIAEDYVGYDIIKNALNFLALTALRTGNVRNLEWEFVDFKNKMIIFPAEKMKMKTDFRLPLTPTLTDILKKMENITKDISKYVFCSVVDYNKQLSENTLNVAHKRMGIDNHTSHGWRSSFSTICYKEQKSHGFSIEVIESQLAHTVGSAVTRAYMRSDFLDERRELLIWWEKFLKSN